MRIAIEVHGHVMANGTNDEVISLSLNIDSQIPGLDLSQSLFGSSCVPRGIGMKEVARKWLPVPEGLRVLIQN